MAHSARFAAIPAPPALDELCVSTLRFFGGRHGAVGQLGPHGAAGGVSGHGVCLVGQVVEVQSDGTAAAGPQPICLLGRPRLRFALCSVARYRI
jgi:hypothetical protein